MCQGSSAGISLLAPISTQDPRAIFDAALSSENIREAHSKPWHLKAIYQLYDERGKAAQQGTYEYWWVSPGVYRSSWTRPGATYTVWHPEAGKFLHEGSGKAIDRFEFKLEDAPLSPLPNVFDLDPERSWLIREDVPMDDGKAACIMVVPRMSSPGKVVKVPRSMFPTYCFASDLPVLRAIHSYGAIGIEFNEISKVQEHYLPREIVLLEGKHKMLSATVESVTDLNPGDPAVIPAQDAVAARYGGLPEIDPSNAGGMLVKKVTPVFPPEELSKRTPGIVRMRVTIGLDGAVHDMQLVEASEVPMVSAVMEAVSQWKYKPFVVDGKPAEVRTIIKVYFLPR
jgi:TonB family protein